MPDSAETGGSVQSRLHRGRCSAGGLMRTPGRRRVVRVRVWGLVALVAMAVAAVLASLALGSKPVPVRAVVDHLLSGSTGYAGMVVDARLPRTVVGFMVGAALGVSGAVLQGITRNPLGDPGLFGVNAGAAASMVTCSLVPPLAALPSFWAALPGALLASGLVCGIGMARREDSPARLVLAGAAISACLFAYVQAITLLNPGVFDAYRFWVTGSLSGLRLDTATTGLPYLAAGLVLVFTLRGAFNVASFDEDTAVALGVSLLWVRLSGLFGAAVLAAVATAMAGPIAFVGLATAHIVRALVGNDFRWLLPYCLFAGAVLLLSADVIGRLVLAPAELMTGVVTAFVGGPFLYYAARKQRGGRS